jgi:hypothetical protein
MLRSVKELHGYVVHATDGDIGRVHEFLFDDQTWDIRYLVCDIGVWLPGRHVLLSPAALERPHYETQMFPVTLTKERVKDSPDIDTDKPVSRQQETALHHYYGWPVYWGAIEPAGGPAAIPVPPAAVASAEMLAGPMGDPHLQSTQDVLDYYIQARDGDLGHVADFIVDDETWTIRYMVIDTRNWWPGKKVLVAPPWITEIDWGEARVHVDMTQTEIKSSPEFDPAAPVNREYEERLFDYYGRPKYWL